MSTFELLEELRRRDVHLRVEEDQLRYTAPKGAMTPGLRARVAEGKGELIRLLTKPSEATKAPPPLTRLDAGGPVRASFAQERLWFLCQFDPLGPSPNLASCLRWPGPLNVGALERSLSEIVRRHEALRTTFREIDGRPFQVVEAAGPAELRLVDLRDRPEESRGAEGQRLLLEEGLRPFDLAQGPLFRALLVRLADAEHLLLLGMHHIVSDGWSIGVLLRELSVVYEAFSSGRRSPLAELPLQYADYARWQREWLQGEVLADLLGYWRERLAGAPAVLELPTDRARPPVQSYRGAVQGFFVAPAVVQGLRELSQSEEATLFMTLLAAFKVLVSRYTGQRDLVMGTPIANRNRLEIEGLVGFFVNTLALRTDLSGDPSFRELLRRVREVTLGAYAHQDLPFERLVEELQPERHLSHHPLFQVMFALQSTPTRAPPGPGPVAGERRDGAESEPPPGAAAPLGLGTAKLDLSLFLEESAEGLGGVLEYATDLFEHATAARLVGHYQTLLAAIVEDPDRPLAELPLLSAEERSTLLEHWNGVETGAVGGESVLHLFQRQVERSPNATAVSFADQTVGYAELGSDANRIANALLGLGVKPGSSVLILQHSGRWQIASLLGVLAAGSAFACADPQHPGPRLAAICEELEPAGVLCDGAAFDVHRATLRQAMAREGAVVVVVDRGGDALDLGGAGPAVHGAEAVASSSEESPKRTAEASAPAYVAFTSGSTGRPKGIVQSNEGFSWFVRWFGRRFELAAPLRVAQWSSITFDASYAEIFGSLCHGATLCLVDPHARVDPVALVDWLRRERISLLQVVPSFLRVLLRQLDSESEIAKPDPLPDLRQALVVGEVLTNGLARAWQQRIPAGGRMYNLYGPTEAVLATCHEVGDIASPNGSVPVGKPIDGCRLAILDAGGRLCPVGVTGEIFIKSKCLTLGYLRGRVEGGNGFVPDPLDSGRGQTVYRTGDLGKWLADGTVEFHGRIDHQVKIRGQRVEPEEVETVLSLHPAVRECAVVASRSEDGELGLVAYAVGPATEEVRLLRSFLRQRLPAYMIPAVFVPLEEMPRTSSLKVNRQALPPPSGYGTGLESRYVAPRNAAEARVAALFRELLGVPQVGVFDDFFDLGGHSLLATQAVNKIRERLSVNIPLRRFFEAPTAAGIAECLVGGDDDEDRLRQLIAAVSEMSETEVRQMTAQMEGER